ncbi:2620_t:CDS:1, partial [Cetraspora pellucida]
GKKLEKIPDSFKCKFNENYIDKTTFEGKEVFETTEVGEYIFYRNSRIFDRYITSLVKECYHDDIDDDDN